MPISEIFMNTPSPRLARLSQNGNGRGKIYYERKWNPCVSGRMCSSRPWSSHTELTPEDEKLLAEILATESDWNRKGEDKEQTEEIRNKEEQPAPMNAALKCLQRNRKPSRLQEQFEVTMTSDAFPDPEDAYAIWDNSRGIIISTGRYGTDLSNRGRCRSRTFKGQKNRCG